MTSKERVLAAIALDTPDRVPLDFSANAPTLRRLLADCGVKDYPGLLRQLHVDMVDLRGIVDPVYRGPKPITTALEGGVTENVWGMRTKTMQTETGPEECYCDFILAACDEIDDLERHPWPSVDWFDFAGFGARLDAWQGYALMASGASVWQHATFLRGMDNLLADFLVNPDVASFLMDRFTDFYVCYFDRMFGAADGRIHILRIADDVGMQDRLLISPEQFETFLAPRLRRLIDMAHVHGVKVMFHSCGAIRPLIDPMIDLGIDILDPLQVRADGMDPTHIKNAFGERICLHGSIDTQYLLPRGTPREVANTVKRMIDVLGRDGGFVLSPSHVLQTDVPTANVQALYDTAHAEGRYRTEA